MSAAEFSKYKTISCKHYEQGGTCTKGDKCLFAHGEGELRQPHDPLPQSYFKGAGSYQQRRMTGQTF